MCEISRGIRGHFEWRDKIDDSSRNFEANMTNFAVSTEPADDLALLGVMISADEIQTRFWSIIHIYIYIYIYIHTYIYERAFSSRDGALRVLL